MGILALIPLARYAPTHQTGPDVPRKTYLRRGWLSDLQEPLLTLALSSPGNPGDPKMYTLT